MKWLVIPLAAFALSAHDIITTKLTFTRDVSRIFARRCLACHGSAGTVPLSTYEEARPWAVAIKEQVLSRQMPPWGAVKGFGHLSPDQGLTQEEILIVAAWVIGGAPKGDPALLSTKPAAKTTLPEPLKDGPIVSGRLKLNQPMTILGLRPLPGATVESARITARFPNGHIEPLLWLYHYQPEWKQTFHFREPVILPHGATVESATPLQFALEIKR